MAKGGGPAGTAKWRLPLQMISTRSLAEPCLSTTLGSEKNVQSVHPVTSSKGGGMQAIGLML